MKISSNNRPRPRFRRWRLTRADFDFLNAFLIAFFAVVTALTAVFIFPPDAGAVAVEAALADNRFLSVMMAPPGKAPPVIPLAATINGPAQPAPHRARNGGRIDNPAAPAPSKSAAANRDRAVAASSGLVAVLSEAAGQRSGVFGTAGIGADIVAALENLAAPAVSTSGPDGIGVRDTVPGGGGPLRLGRIGGLGTGLDGPGAFGPEGGEGGAPRRPRGPSVGTDQPIIVGALDKELIRRVIRAHRNQIRYCYERELPRSPGLFGKITLMFIIGATGAVAAAKIKESSMQNAAVEECLIQRAQTWKFPAPAHGGVVVVSYPFIFTQS